MFQIKDIDLHVVYRTHPFFGIITICGKYDKEDAGSKVLQNVVSVLN
jgi:hypothetical protein